MNLLSMSKKLLAEGVVVSNDIGQLWYRQRKNHRERIRHRFLQECASELSNFHEKFIDLVLRMEYPILFFIVWRYVKLQNQ